jgi:phosphoribosylformylglycinamidine synthase subunit PurL
VGREEAPPPPVDLAKEKRYGDFVRNLINAGQVTAVHDISDGGLGAAVAEMALASGLGATLDSMTHEQLFAEDQARYVLTCKASEAAKIITQAHVKGIDVIGIGNTGGVSIVCGEWQADLAALKSAHEGWFPSYMGS